jgi:hypothetical protein
MEVLSSTARPSGPDVPSYVTPSIIISSKPLSVLNDVTESTPGSFTVIVHDSELP